MSKNDQNFDRFQEADPALKGAIWRTAWGSWGEYKGGDYMPQMDSNLKFAYFSPHLRHPKTICDDDD